ncbi:TolB family protein [Nonomuraea roseoviolacea]|uniref:WD40 repeat domain-containing protein n=1 Tax=Nonomuraea roseoviolacea subsp. carminata TaxID=160689 RepID=A0ABT1KEZ5_9ACTN|nr:hypothetical protein [Nonomuraea roseoviolacea]MCP2352589.1 hypothetical protein [Nonomuraea roseoviolacea subsp. carminata]
MNPLEDALRRTLTGAAGRAPQAPVTLSGAVEARYRRRRNRTRAALAAAAVVALVGGATFALKGGTPRAMPATPPTTKLPPAIEKVWPRAIHDLPARLPDGRAFYPHQLIDERTLLVTPEDDATRPDAVYAYDVETHAARKIADLTVPKRTVSFPSGFAAGSGRVVWWTALEGGLGQIWSAPLSGGPAHLVASRPVDDGGFDALTVAGDRIVFSLEEGGVFTVPLRGGTVEPVKGGADSHLLAWPWISRPGRASVEGEPMFGTIRNVETGQTSTALTRRGEEMVFCGLELCMGRSDRGVGFVRRRDGSGERPDPCAAARPTGGSDRFCTESVHGTGRSRVGVVLRDRTSGKSADLGIRNPEEPMPLPEPHLMFYIVQGRMRLVDLTKIP